MLTQLKIRNFQALAKANVRLDPHVTCFIGPTDVGKSSMVRALRWLCTNQPAGDAHIRDGEKSCSVRLVTDKHVITRKRTPSANVYMLDDQEFRSFGASVPEPIAKALNVGPINFQNQFDSPFWLSDSAGQVSRNLNAVVDLDVIDRALAAISKRVNRSRTAADVIDGQYKEAKERAAGLKWVPEAQKGLKRLEGWDRAKDSLEARVGRLGASTNKAIEYRGKAKRLLDAASGAARMVSAGSRVDVMHRKVYRLNLLITDAKRFQEIKAPDTEKLDRVAIIVIEGEREIVELGQMIQRNEARKGIVMRKRKEARKAQVELKQAMKGRCPICGTEMGK